MQRPRVIFVAGWYPNEDHPLNGIFIQRHARAVSPWCDVGVVYVHQSMHRFRREMVVTVEEGIPTVRIYLPRPPFGNIPLDLIYLNTVNSRLVHALRGIRTLVRTLGGVDIIHLHEIRPMGLAAVLAARRYRVPLVTTEHSSEYHVAPLFGIERRKCQTILEESALVLPVSHALELDLNAIAPEVEYRIIPNVVDTSSFTPSSGSKAYLRKRLIHVSLLDDGQKNVSGLLDALARLRKIRDDFELHIVGDGPDREILECQSKSLNLSDIVVYHGMVTEDRVRALLRQAHVFVLNSPYETFGIAGIEALASGVPVISTRCGGPEEYIDNSNGILIDVGDTDGLIDAINTMLDSWQMYDRDALHGAIVRKYSEEIIGKALASVYEDMLGCSI